MQRAQPPPAFRPCSPQGLGRIKGPVTVFVVAFILAPIFQASISPIQAPLKEPTHCGVEQSEPVLRILSGGALRPSPAAPGPLVYRRGPISRVQKCRDRGTGIHSGAAAVGQHNASPSHNRRCAESEAAHSAQLTIPTRHNSHPTLPELPRCRFVVHLARANLSAGSADSADFVAPTLADLIFPFIPVTSALNWLKGTKWLYAGIVGAGAFVCEALGVKLGEARRSQEQSTRFSYFILHTQ